MKRTVYVYSLKAVNTNEKYYKNIDSFEDDFCDIILKLCNESKVSRKQDIKTEKKVIYVTGCTYKKSERTIYVQFTSARYDSVRNVVDTETLAEKASLIKGKNDGEEECNYMAIKFVDDFKAICLYETNYYGVGFTRAIKYLEHFEKIFHRKQKEKISYNIVYKNLVSKNFLEALGNVGRIKMVTLEVDRTAINVSEQKDFARKSDLSDTADIVFRPSGKGNSILTDTVKDFFKMYNNRNSSIKSVTVDGEDCDKEPIRFDTEAMKEKIVIDVESNSRGEVKISSIYREFKEILGKY